MPNIFVSYRDEDQDYRNDFAGLIGGTTEIKYSPVVDRQNFRSSNEDRSDEIREYLLEKLGECSALALLVGNNTHNGKWVDYEIDVAQNQDKKIIAVRIPGTTGGLPSRLRNRVPILNWTGSEVREALD